MVYYLCRFRVNSLPLLGRTDKGDVGRDGEGQLAVAVCHRRAGQIGQGEECSPLAYATGIQVLLGYHHAGFGPSVAHLYQLDAGIYRKAVVLQKLFDIHGRISFYFLVMRAK